MTLEQAILEAVRELPSDKQQEILDFAEFLRQRLNSSSPTQVSLAVDPIWGLGETPTSVGISDAAENHDQYLYGSAQ